MNSELFMDKYYNGWFITDKLTGKQFTLCY